MNFMIDEDKTIVLDWAKYSSFFSCWMLIAVQAISQCWQARGWNMSERQ